MWLLRTVIGALALLGLAIAVAPEPRGQPMAGAQLTVISGAPGSVLLAAITERDASIPSSLKAPGGAALVRSWTAEHGVQPLVAEFGPLKPAAFVGVVHQGTIWARDGRNALYLRCSAHDRTKPISIGGTNTTVVETIVPLGPDWCRGGEVYLRVIGASRHNLGVAAPFEASALAYLKQSYLGYVGYFLVAFGAILAAFVAGGLAARGSRSGLDPTLGGLLGVGGLSLIAFYAYAWTPLPSPAAALLTLGAMASIGLARLRAPKLLASVWAAQRGPVQAWFLVAFVTFTLLHLGATGSGSWEPAYRYAPASWSSDHTLPTLFAEAARVGALPAEGLLGGWSLSDRPPLMAGAYLLFADAFAALQINNDGPHLQPVVLGIGGIALCALWAAALYWAARRLARLSAWSAGCGVAIVAATPLALFNTGYTWPKLLAAAFGLAAAADVFRPRAGRIKVGEAATFGALSGLAMLCHAASTFFLAPVALVYFAVRLWRSPKAAVVGAAVGLALLASWAGFKVSVLPSPDPLMAYALTGDLILDAPKGSLPGRLAARYDYSLSQWAQTKAEIGAYLFTPFPAPGPEPLIRPPGPLDGDVPAQLRNWDFFSLTAGNVTLLALGALGAWGAVVARRRTAPQSQLSGRLLLSVAGCYGLFVGVTFLPLFNHQFSYDAILALALAGLAIAGRLRRGGWLLAALAAAGLLYSLAVWGIAPLAGQVRIDLAAALALAAVAAAGLLALRPAPLGVRGQALAALALAGLIGALLLAWPAALLRETQIAAVVPRVSDSLPAADPARCIGYVDSVVGKRRGGWRVYGWAWDVPGGAPVVAVRLFDAGGGVLGETRDHNPRPDVEAAIAAVTQPAVGWSLDVARRPAGATAVAILSDGTQCRLPGSQP